MRYDRITFPILYKKRNKKIVQSNLTIILLIMGIYGFVTFSIKRDQMYKDLKFSISRVKKRLQKNLGPVLFEENTRTAKNIVRSELKEFFISILVLFESIKVIGNFSNFPQLFSFLSAAILWHEICLFSLMCGSN